MVSDSHLDSRSPDLPHKSRIIMASRKYCGSWNRVYFEASAQLKSGLETVFFFQLSGLKWVSLKSTFLLLLPEIQTKT